MLRDDTRARVRAILLEFTCDLREKARSYDTSSLRTAYPFHQLLFPEESLWAFKVQRSFVTRMGQRLIPRLAREIAGERFRRVYIDREISGSIDEARLRAIDRIVNDLRSGRRRPNHRAEIGEIMGLVSGRAVPVSIIADLFVEDFYPGPLFIEFKSPLPNLDVCAESKRKMLIFKALYWDRNPQAYLGLYYNPFHPEPYRHPFTGRVMDMDAEVLVGEALWDMIGGIGTFRELLDLIDEVSREAARGACLELKGAGRS